MLIYSLLRLQKQNEHKKEQKKYDVKGYTNASFMAQILTREWSWYNNESFFLCTF
jgi:hypothetical protein